MSCHVRCCCFPFHHHWAGAPHWLEHQAPHRQGLDCPHVQSKRSHREPLEGSVESDTKANGILPRKDITGANYKSVIPVHTETGQNQDRGGKAYPSHLEVFRKTDES